MKLTSVRDPKTHSAGLDQFVKYFFGLESIFHTFVLTEK